jgi:hypothetical protein
MREQCDPVADEVVRSLFQEGQVGGANALMRLLVRNEDLVPGQLPAPLRGYLEASAHRPSWMDKALLEQGERVFGRYGPTISVALFCASLPSCYAAAKGVQVLHLTARLATDPFRRIVETGQMLVDVLSPGGLGPHGRGLRTVQKVRLMHAAVRHLVRDSGQWRPEWGQPINQEDLAGTLQTFSTVVLRSLEKLGVQLSDTERRGYFHAWRVVGYGLGIDERLLPAEPEDGARLFDAIARRQFQESPEGREMTVALMALLEHATPGNLFDGMGPTLMRHLMGEETARLLAVPPSDWTGILMGPLKALGWVGDAVGDSGPGLARLSELFGRKVLEGLVWVGRGPERTPFQIPDILRQSWDVRGWERA